jgi:uncharacterized protein (DUF1501 family)
MRPNRRQFLTAALGAAAAPLLPRIATARRESLLARAALRSPRKERVVVLVDLVGGNDGLNTVVPYGLDPYHAARPTLRLEKEQLLPLRDGIGLRRELAGLHPLFEKGQLAIVQAVGYPGPDRSHFRSSDVWHSGSLTPETTPTGWIGRLCGCAGIAGKERTPALMIGVDRVPLLLVGEDGPAPQVESLDRLELPAGPADDGIAARRTAMEELARRGGGPGAGDPRGDELLRKLDFLRDQTRTAQENAALVAAAAKRGRTHASYPKTPLGGSFELAARLLTGGFDCSAYLVEQPGYDTHVFQADPHALLLKDLGDALAAFWSDVVANGAADRTVVLVWSEFGRRVQENGSKGTDHGAAAPVFVLGGAVKGGLVGEAPSLEPRDLVDGDVKFATDFRRIYATLLDDWFEVDSKSVLGESFPKLPLLAKSS